MVRAAYGDHDVLKRAMAFFATAAWPSRAAARTAIFEYIESRFNLCTLAGTVVAR
ncbi:hypothetical protein NRF20_42865 [Streptomyces sp. R-74717]|uniref:hypothetical protein n=1 Tax=Streptomyces TaxID=1883 RepID=UPI00225A28BE|nr:hypothetical protein [Streptomyces atratus]MCX5346057.1 hypothetical protein [Streptomyces atratus]